MDKAIVKTALQEAMKIVDEAIPLVANREIEWTAHIRAVALPIVFTTLLEAES